MSKDKHPSEKHEGSRSGDFSEGTGRKSDTISIEHKPPAIQRTEPAPTEPAKREGGSSSTTTKKP